MHLQLHRGIGLVGGRECSSVLCECGSAPVVVDLESRHHLIHNGVGVVKPDFIYCTYCLYEFKESFAEVIFEVIPRFVRLVCALPLLDAIFEDSLPV